MTTSQSAAAIAELGPSAREHPRRRPQDGRAIRHAGRRDEIARIRAGTTSEAAR